MHGGYATRDVIYLEPWGTMPGGGRHGSFFGHTFFHRLSSDVGAPAKAWTASGRGGSYPRLLTQALRGLKLYMYIYVCIHVYIHIYIYTYIFIYLDGLDKQS